MNKRQSFVIMSALLFIIIALAPIAHVLTKYLPYIEVTDAVFGLLFILFVVYRLNQSFKVFKEIDIHTKLKPVIGRFKQKFGNISKQSYYTQFKFWLSNFDNKFNNFFNLYDIKKGDDKEFKQIQAFNAGLEHTNIDTDHFYSSLSQYFLLYSDITDEYVLQFCDTYFNYIIANITKKGDLKDTIKQNINNFIKTDIARENCLFSPAFIKSLSEDKNAQKVYIQGHVSLKNVMQPLYSNMPASIPASKVVLNSDEISEEELKEKHNASDLFQVKTEKVAMAFTKVKSVLAGLIINKVEDNKGQLLSNIIKDTKGALEGAIAFWRIDDGESDVAGQIELAADTYKNLSTGKNDSFSGTKLYCKFLSSGDLAKEKTAVLAGSEMKENQYLISPRIDNKSASQILSLARTK